MTPTTLDAYQLFHDGSIALAQVEQAGMRVDLGYLESASKETEDQIRELKDELVGDSVFRLWKQRFGEKTSLGNHEQLGAVVFGDLGYERREESVELNEDGEIAKTSNDEAAFAHVDHPFVKKWTLRQKRIKCRGYFNQVKRELVGDRARPFFNLNTVVSFRGSSDRFNFQNIPIRDPGMAALLRPMFIPSEGHVLVEFDFKGAEIRVAYCYHKDPTMGTYIRDQSKDMHRDMASQIYMCNKSEVSGAMRHCGKNMFVFPQFYGASYVNCARDLWQAIVLDNLKIGDESLEVWLKDRGITGMGRCNREEKPIPGTFENHLKEVSDHFWNERFPVYTQWKREWWDSYKATGKFKMLTGFEVKGAWTRTQVINMPVQGASFHCLLWCLIRMVRYLRKNKMRSKVVGQIHDSIVADVHVSELPDYIETLKYIITEALPEAWKWLICPMEVEAGVTPEGGSWYDKKKVNI